MRRARILVVVATLIAAFSLVALSPAASAAPGGCGTVGRFCAYKDVNYFNGPWAWYNSENNWHDWTIADRDSSWWSNQSQSVRVYVNTGYGGSTEVCIRGYNGDAAAIAVDDRGSSHLEVSGC